MDPKDKHAKTTDASVAAATTSKPSSSTTQESGRAGAVTAEAPKPAVQAEAPKPAVQAPATPRSTPVNERRYKLIAAPSIPPRGRQRQIVLEILQNAKEPMTVAEVTKLATEKGLQAVGGVGPSCRYHLHHLCLLKIADVVNPTTGETVAQAVEAKPAAQAA